MRALCGRFEWLRRSAPGNGGNEYRVRKAAVESRQLPFAASYELSKMGICHLSVTDHTASRYISERDTVRPELVAVSTLDCSDDISRGCRGLPRPQQESNKAPLCDRARRKSCVGCRQPFRGGVVMHMLGDDQCDEHVRVEQRGQSSSSNERTSSEVTTVPTLTRGNPVLGSMEISSVLPALSLNPWMVGRQ